MNTFNPRRRSPYPRPLLIPAQFGLCASPRHLAYRYPTPRHQTHHLPARYLSPSSSSPNSPSVPSSAPPSPSFSPPTPYPSPSPLPSSSTQIHATAPCLHTNLPQPSQALTSSSAPIPPT